MPRLALGFALLLYMLLTVAPRWAEPALPEGRELIGKQAPDWPELRWLGPPLRIRELRGKVVLNEAAPWQGFVQPCNGQSLRLGDHPPSP